MIIYIKRLFFKLLGYNPAKMEMVQYWKKSGAVQAKVTEENGVTVMKMEGEKYTFPGFPRGWLLFGKLSKLKHEIKNQIFNDAWAKLEAGVPEEKIVRDIKQNVLPNIYTLFDELKYDIIPSKKMVPAVRDIQRAWKKVAPNSIVCDIVAMILQEDDSYRFRLQWMVAYFGGGNPSKKFQRGLEWLEQGEIIGDMKERVRLVRRILLMLIRDKEYQQFFNAFFKEVNWRKVKMSKADKFFFRGKYFKVDLDKFDY